MPAAVDPARVALVVVVLVALLDVDLVVAEVIGVPRGGEEGIPVLLLLLLLLLLQGPPAGPGALDPAGPLRVGDDEPGQPDRLQAGGLARTGVQVVWEFRVCVWRGVGGGGWWW